MPIWAHDEREERAAFERWVDWITERLAAHPDAHIYHYNHYEPTALKRLMSTYGTRETELDELLRREVFVDLYTVVRQAMRVGEPGYSLKNMEAFYPLERDAEVTEAGGSILAYQEWLESRDRAKLDAIAEYNADDCRSTRALRDWLLDERHDAERMFETVLPNRDAKPPRELSERAAQRRSELQQLQERLTAGLPEQTGDPDERARLLMAELLEYHRREAKPEWWTYFERMAMTPRELARGRQRGARRSDPRDGPRGPRGQAVVDLSPALPAAGAQDRPGQSGRARDRARGHRRRRRRRRGDRVDQTRQAVARSAAPARPQPDQARRPGRAGGRPAPFGAASDRPRARACRRARREHRPAAAPPAHGSPASRRARRSTVTASPSTSPRSMTACSSPRGRPAPARPTSARG